MSMRNSWRSLWLMFIYVIVWPACLNGAFHLGVRVSLFGSGLSAAVALRVRILDRIGAEEAWTKTSELCRACSAAFTDGEHPHSPDDDEKRPA
jgi:hypothetical protein